MALPTFEEAAGGAATGANTSLDLPQPTTGIQADDLLVAVVAEKITGLGVTTPSGWTLHPITNPPLASGSLSDDLDSFYLFYKRATGSESGDETFARTDGGMCMGRIYRYRGVITTGDPFEDMDSNDTSSGTQSTTVLTAAGGLTTLGPDRLGVLFCALGDNDTVGPWDQGWSETVAPHLYGQGTDGCMAVGDQDIVSATTIPQASATYASPSHGWVILTAALKPPAGGGSTVLGSASVVATSSVTAAARSILRGSASIQAVSTVTAIGTLSGIVRGVASIIASSAVTARGRTTLRGRASISSTSSVTAVGSILGVIRGAASVVATSTVTAKARSILRGSASIIGTSTVTARETGIATAAQLKAERAARRMNTVWRRMARRDYP